MVTADALSRIISLIEVSRLEQEDDPEYMKLLHSVNEVPERRAMFQVFDGRLYKKNKLSTHDFNGSWNAVVPRSAQLRVLGECHDSEHAAHGGIYKTLYRLRQDYYWPRMKRDAITYVRQCEVCKAAKPPNSNQRAFMGKERSPRKKFQMIAIDYLGPMPTYTKGNQYMFVIIYNIILRNSYACSRCAEQQQRKQSNC